MKDLLNIPESGLAGMRALANWSEADFTSMLQLVSNAGIRLFPEKWIPESAPEQPAMTAKDVFSFAGMVRSLLWTWSGTKLTLDQFLDLAAASAQGAASKNYKFEAEDVAVIRKRLGLVLGLRSLRLSSKASEVYSGVERPIKSVSITSELKPVFDPHAGDLGAFLLAYTLKVDYVQDDESRACFYSMDSNDIDELIVSLQRAKRDAGDLMAAIEPGGLSIVVATPEMNR